MPRLIGVAVVFAMLLFSSTAVADDDKTQFYNFDAHVVDGEFQQPEIGVFSQPNRPDFERLIQLQTSFLDDAHEDAGQLQFR